jgi:uncharacterized protein YggE
MEFFKKQFSDRHHNITLLVGVLIIFLAVLTISTAVGIQNKIKEGRYIGQEIETKNTIMVSETGEVYAKPDLALTTFSVKTEAKTVAQAMTENTEKMNDIIDFMKDSGIEEKDLKTTTFNIYPCYEYRRDNLIYPSGSRVLVGYEVIQSLQVKIRDLEKIGQIIQGATEAGANQAGDLQFTIDQEDELKKQAREQAIDKAKDKAEELASQLGVNLVRITSFSESGQFPRYDYALKEATSLGGGETPQIETGENKIEVTVTITYEIN